MRRGSRRAAGLVAAIVAAAATIAAAEATAHALLPPDGAVAAAAAGLGIAALAGGLVATRIGRWPALRWVVAAVLAALSLVNVLSFPHPAWFVPVAAAALLTGAWVAGRLVPVRNPAP